MEELEVKQLSLLQTSFGENWCKNSAVTVILCCFSERKWARNSDCSSYIFQGTLQLHPPHQSNSLFHGKILFLVCQSIVSVEFMLLVVKLFVVVVLVVMLLVTEVLV